MLSISIRRKNRKIKFVKISINYNLMRIRRIFIIFISLNFVKFII